MKKLFNSEEEVNQYLGIQTIGNPDLSWIQPENRKSILATAKLQNVFAAHNKANNYSPDYRRGKRNDKYSAWKEIEATDDKPSGVGFSSTDYGRWVAHSLVGSRLECGSYEEAMHIGVTFDYLYKDILLLE